jgi:biopolymer transport protein ExbD
MIRLARQTRPLPVISIIPLVDVLLILLVFFLVTSTFLNLDMLPMSEPEAQGATNTTDNETVLIRVLPGGDIAAGNLRVPPDGIATFLAERRNARIMLLPSPQTELQALVRVLDTAAELGVSSINVVQFSEAN